MGGAEHVCREGAAGAALTHTLEAPAVVLTAHGLVDLGAAVAVELLALGLVGVLKAPALDLRALLAARRIAAKATQSDRTTSGCQSLEGIWRAWRQWRSLGCLPVGEVLGAESGAAEARLGALLGRGQLEVPTLHHREPTQALAHCTPQHNRNVSTGLADMP